MRQLTINLPQEVFERLHEQATCAGTSIELLASKLLSEQLPQTELSERERAREVLRAAGMLTELGPELKRRAAEATLSLDEIQAIFRRVGGKPLSEIVIEQRGPKA